MKKHLLGARATLALALFSGIVPAAAACDPATHAVQYLLSKQLANGSIDGNVNETADFVLGAASDGIDPKSLKSSGAKSPFDFFAADLVAPRAEFDVAEPDRLLELGQLLDVQDLADDDTAHIVAEPVDLLDLEPGPQESSRDLVG